jgi:hypothetical protein
LARAFARLGDAILDNVALLGVGFVKGLEVFFPRPWRGPWSVCAFSGGPYGAAQHGSKDRLPSVASKQYRVASGKTPTSSSYSYHRTCLNCLSEKRMYYLNCCALFIGTADGRATPHALARPHCLLVDRWEITQDRVCGTSQVTGTRRERNGGGSPALRL